MEEIMMNVGTLLKKTDGTTWRVFVLDGEMCRMIQTEIERRIISTCSIPEVLGLISSGLMKLVNDSPLVVDEKALNAEQRKDYRKKLDFILEFRQLYGPSFSGFINVFRKPEYKALYERYGFSSTLAERIVRRWFQSGLQNASLLSQNVMRQGREQRYNFTTKTGRKTDKPQGIIIDENAIEAFEYGLAQFKRGRMVSLTEAYVRMLGKYYVDVSDGGVKLLSPDQRPTEKQFRYYVQKNFSKEEMAKVKTSVAEYRNNERLLFGTARDDSLRPGSILEADAVELDMNIVSSSDRGQNISRPIVYMLIDTYSHCIVAFYVGFDNNSMLGLSSLMLNLIEDKDALLARKGIRMDLSAWPSTFIPAEIRCDRGSDFASDQFRNICMQLGIRRTLETGAMGSMKPHIERSFGLLHQGLMADFEHLGYIQKRYDSNHKKEACLTIDGIFLLILRFIIEHNLTPIKKMKISQNEIAGGVDKSPISLWRYGTAQYGNPEPVTPFSYASKVFSLLPEETATISREGISFHGLLYITKNDEDLLNRMKLAKANGGKRDVEGNRINSMKIRFDPRSVNNLYYQKNGKLMTLEINPTKNAGVRDMTWSEYEKYREQVKLIDKQGNEIRLQLRLERQGFNSCIAQMYQSETYASATGIVEARREERNRTNFDNRIQQRVEDENPVETSLLKDEAQQSPPDKDVPVDQIAGTVFSDECPADLYEFMN